MTERKDQRPRIPPDYWPCCCTKRNRAGDLVKIKFNPPDRQRCNVCKAERPETEEESRGTIT